MVTDGNRRRKMNECRDETDEPAAKKALFKLPREQRNEKRHILRTSFNKVHELFYEKPNIRKALSISNTIRRLRSELLHDIDYIISVDSASVLEPWEDAYRNRENSLKAVVTFKDGVDAVSVICDNITLAEEVRLVAVTPATTPSLPDLGSVQLDDVVAVANRLRDLGHRADGVPTSASTADECEVKCSFSVDSILSNCKQRTRTRAVSCDWIRTRVML